VKTYVGEANRKIGLLLSILVGREQQHIKKN
jgi:hypothetical protein